MPSKVDRRRLHAAVLAIAPALGLVVPAASADQLRPGLPAVEGPRAREDVEGPGRETLAAFQRWSEAQGRPSVVLFWDRELSDETTTRNRVRLSDDRIVQAAPGVVASRRDLVVQEEPTTGGGRDTLSDSRAALMESAFLNVFLEGGGRVMDRNALMRRASAPASASDRADMQFMETVALAQGVRYLVEVLVDHDLQSPTGLSFRIKVTDLRASEVVARFVANGAPPATRRRLVAAPGGFQREAVEPPSPEAIGTQRAIDVMTRLL